ncbi:hypothetical protein EA795_00045 [Stutzerimonas nitrititolerans]|uniref:Uncharacterized protein n=2 Tax=Stutzerimonas nitrititolerans TaxID=2482751 RepID=A0ABX9V9H3_9GAMM|nr:hypothetical protein EA795_00045 [Stutzerimonas nitrititolerans]
MANEMAVQLEASIVCSQAAGRSCDAAYEQGKWSQVAQVHDSWEVMSELITARTDLILISAAAANGWQQHRLTQAPLKTLRKTEALGASLDNIV